MQYALGIVTYQPDIARLKENLEAAVENLQGGPILVVDNGSERIADIQSLTEGFSTVTLIRNSENLGIATALNQLCRQAQSLGCQWIITLDQDSVIQPGMLQEFSRYTHLARVAIICPRIEDRRLGRQHTRLTSGTEYISHAITAGNMVRLEAWQTVGGFTEQLFIDGVDFDFCLKLGEDGWQILRTNIVCLYQEMGHGRKITLPFHHQMSVLNHSPQRLYYIARNYLWIGRRHHQRLHWSLEVAKRLFIVLCFESQKWQKLRAMFKGIRHSYIMNNPT